MPAVAGPIVRGRKSRDATGGRISALSIPKELRIIAEIRSTSSAQSLRSFTLMNSPPCAACAFRNAILLDQKHLVSHKALSRPSLFEQSLMLARFAEHLFVARVYADRSLLGFPPSQLRE